MSRKPKEVKMDLDVLLRNCPFCGTAPKLRYTKKKFWFECPKGDCGVFTRQIFDTVNEAAIKWNTRAEFYNYFGGKTL